MHPKKLKGKRKTQDPCEGCFLHRSLCICAEIPRIKTQTRLSLVIHAKEMRRTTNTGLLAARVLINSEVLVRGLRDAPLDLTRILVPEYRSLLFYPCEEATDIRELDRGKDSRPVHLIVPDGNWRQASKVGLRHKELSSLERVMVKTPNHETSHMRLETMAVGMATLQAIAHAFAALEGDSAGNALMTTYQLKLAATLKGRGQLNGT